MTSTSFNIGYNCDEKISSKVLKPPGGGTSDIFGIQTPAPEIRQKINPQQVSTIFGAPPEVPRKINPQQVSSIFEINTARSAAQKSEVAAEPVTSEVQEQKSVQAVNDTKMEASVQPGAVSSGPTTSKRYDPITGEGTRQQYVQPSVRIRNPPGGKSSGIF